MMYTSMQIAHQPNSNPGIVPPWLGGPTLLGVPGPVVGTFQPRAAAHATDGVLPGPVAGPFQPWSAPQVAAPFRSQNPGIVPPWMNGASHGAVATTFVRQSEVTSPS